MSRRVEVGPQLISSTSPYFHELVSWAWRRAKELAARMSGSIETLRPDHFYGNEAQDVGYMLKVGEIYPGNVLPERTYLIIYGIFNTDETLDYIQISDGRRTYDWYVLPVLYYTERMAAWGEGPIVLDAYSTKIYVHSLDPNKDRVYAWFLGFVIKPRETAQPSAEEGRGRRGGRRRR
ncbi:MAG: hypothetical protein GXO26_02280 [Crenarchaeota archaeon]|nr:hypothetical protein [Thermoproteota archaeon]